MFKNFFSYFYELKNYVATTLQDTFSPPLRATLIFHEFEKLIHQALPIIFLCLGFAAMVTISESSFHMKMVLGDDSLVPGFASILILRELGVVVSALLLVARSGAAITAEMATQKVTEQIEALRMLGVRPLHFLIGPKLIAFTIGTPLLTILSNTFCLIIAIGISYLKLDVSFESFLTAFRRFASGADLFLSLIKGVIFGFSIPLICGFFALRCRGGAKEVGQVTTRSVVVSSVWIILADFCITFIFGYFFF